MTLAVVTGMIASYPVGGVAWDYGQYALGLERLGIDVVYLEDTGWLCYDPRLGDYGEDPSYGLEFLQGSLNLLSPALGKRWHFRAMDDSVHGMDRATLREAIAEADIFLNVSGGTILRPEYMSARNKTLIDTDPGWNHFRNWPQWRPKPDWPESASPLTHDHFFTYAERLGRPDCPLPDFGKKWHPTRPPVVMDCWAPQPPGTTWTTVMTWKNFQERIEYKGVLYGTKELEFPRLEDLPSRVDADLEIALGGADAPVSRWRDKGWSVVDSESVSRTAEEYRTYVERSRGEFSVAKNIYVATNCGWFSCRSVCYLSSGRPVVTQDTRFSEVIPTGKGLIAFTSRDEAADAIMEVENDYENHCIAAKELARTHFDSGVVLQSLLERIGVGG